MNRLDIPRGSLRHPLRTGTVPKRRETTPATLHTEVTDLAGKRVLVTGGTTGIGRAVGALLASYGARIFTFGRNQKPLDEALDYIRAAGGEAEGVTGDLTEADDIRRIFAKADAVFGGVDVLGH